MNKCPLEDAHLRLLDVHEHIHLAIENYFEPSEFRRNLNNALQDARNVTWLLQKKKANFNNFETFYGEWQQDIQNNLIMKWSVSARNQVTKESDLVKSSKMVATIFTAKSVLSEESFEVSPEISTSECISQILRGRGPVNNPNELVLRIERLWIAENLPRVEITDALIEVFRNLKKIIARAHLELGIKECILANQRRPCVTSDLNVSTECFGQLRGFRSISVSLKTGKKVEMISRVIERDDSKLPEILNHYGKDKVDQMSEDPHKQVFERLEMLRMFISKDGSTMPFLLIEGLHGDQKLFMIPMGPDSSQSLIIREAFDSLGAWPFSRIIFSTETWISNSKPKSELFNVDENDLLPSSSEFDKSKFGELALDAIAIYMLEKNKSPLSIFQAFTNTKSGVVFGPVITSKDWSSVPASLRAIFSSFV